MLVVAHRRELIEQISQTLNRFGIEHGLIVSGKAIDESKGVQVASIQTLTRRGRPLPSPDREGDRGPSLVIVDEAHHALAKTYKVLWERKIGDIVYMRQCSRQWDRPMRANGIYRNRRYIIFDGMLVFTNDPDKEAFQVCGYDKYFVYIRKPRCPEPD